MAATAYSSLVSLMIVLTRYQNPTCPVLFNQSQIQTLLDKVTSLVDFLEDYYDPRRNTKTNRVSIQALERKMTRAANSAEDIVESYYVDRVVDSRECLTRPYEFILHSDLEKAIQEMDEIVQESMEVGVKKHKSETNHSMRTFLSQGSDSNKHAPVIQSSEKSGSMPKHQEDPLALTLTPTTEYFLPNLNDNIATSSSSTNTVVGFDEQLSRLMNRIRVHNTNRVIITIVGMGGIGKTTLATNVYNLPYLRQHFDIRAWVTISQHYVVKDIILSLLDDMKVEGNCQMDDEQLGDLLYKGLFGKRYIIVLDDIWDIQAWNEIMRFFPDNRNGSRILLTTRDQSIGRRVGSSSTYEMEFLNDDESFNLLAEKVYGKEAFPRELEKLGKAITRSCKGLPLAIVVIAGVLKTCSRLEYWMEFSENLSSVLRKDDSGQCLGILSLSYSHLPIHLKQCFLHMATFKEDAEIDVSKITNLWIAEGFLKPSNDKNLNDIALVYLNDLIDRNLIVDNGLESRLWTFWWLPRRTISMHDSLRELCIRESENEDFMYIVDEDTPNLRQRLQWARRIVIKNSIEESKLLLPSILYARSISIIGDHKIPAQRSFSCRLLRVFNNMSTYSRSQIDIPELINVRYIKGFPIDKWWDSLPLYWNLEIFRNTSDRPLPSEIWDLQYLRQLDCRYLAVDPPASQSNCVLKNLQTIHDVIDFFCTDEVFRRIPNLKKLSVKYTIQPSNELSHSFNNLGRLPKLESLSLGSRRPLGNSICAFPRNLVKLNLEGSKIPWENMTIVGCLPNLEVLILYGSAFCGNKWNSSEGEFQRLKHLTISGCRLNTWNAESYHFPRLEHLKLADLELKEIPLGIGEIESLECIQLVTRKISIVRSAKKILKERRNNQGDDDDLVVEGLYWREDWSGQLAKWAENYHNFRIEWFP